MTTDRRTQTVDGWPLEEPQAKGDWVSDNPSDQAAKESATEEQDAARRAQEAAKQARERVTERQPPKPQPVPESASPALPPVVYSFDERLGPFFADFAKAQKEYKPIVRTKEVEVRTRDGRSYTFKYAPLEDVLDATVPALNAHGLAFSQDLISRGGKRFLVTTLTHASGASKSSILELPAAERPQEIGSMLTYMRRYNASPVLGVSSEDDDDGNTAEGNQATVKSQKPQPWRNR